MPPALNRIKRKDFYQLMYTFPSSIPISRILQQELTQLGMGWSIKKDGTFALSRNFIESVDALKIAMIGQSEQLKTDLVDTAVEKLLELLKKLYAEYDPHDNDQQLFWEFITVAMKASIQTDFNEELVQKYVVNLNLILLHVIPAYLFKPELERKKMWGIILLKEMLTNKEGYSSTDIQQALLTLNNVYQNIYNQITKQYRQTTRPKFAIKYAIITLLITTAAWYIGIPWLCYLTGGLGTLYTAFYSVTHRVLNRKCSDLYQKKGREVPEQLLHNIDKGDFKKAFIDQYPKDFEQVKRQLVNKCKKDNPNVKTVEFSIQDILKYSIGPIVTAVGKYYMFRKVEEHNYWVKKVISLPDSKGSAMEIYVQDNNVLLDFTTNSPLLTQTQKNKLKPRRRTTSDKKSLSTPSISEIRDNKASLSENKDISDEKNNEYISLDCPPNCTVHFNCKSLFTLFCQNRFTSIAKPIANKFRTNIQTNRSVDLIAETEKNKSGSPYHSSDQYKVRTQGKKFKNFRLVLAQRHPTIYEKNELKISGEILSPQAVVDHQDNRYVLKKK